MRIFLGIIMAISVAPLFGCGPTEQEIAMRQLDSKAAKIMNDLILLYESTDTESDVRNNIDHLVGLHNSWLENREIADEMDLESEVFQESWQRYELDWNLFDHRFRLHKRMVDCNARHFQDTAVVQSLRLFHQQMQNDWSLIPARNRVSVF